jgi:hypothetical protein
MVGTFNTLPARRLEAFFSHCSQVWFLPTRNRFSFFHPSRPEIVIENIWINIRSIAPCNRAALDFHGGKHVWIIAGLFKNGAVEIWLKVYFPLKTILKDDPDRETPEGLDSPSS